MLPSGNVWCDQKDTCKFSMCKKKYAYHTVDEEMREKTTPKLAQRTFPGTPVPVHTKFLDTIMVAVPNTLSTQRVKKIIGRKATHTSTANRVGWSRTPDITSRTGTPVLSKSQKAARAFAEEKEKVEFVGDLPNLSKRAATPA
ncbi:hypothetical protein AOQ84DRAFT_357811 [Glonium stellatum]|uniref:Uncharacterized protein n=1 Tax=Glonium stellatum TaxID=574774 RepID=A0A8E2JLX7_9PEZI|nr:hypothetical protein AOQ84DRAFT_357811 [Glonium stellatum]